MYKIISLFFGSLLTAVDSFAAVLGYVHRCLWSHAWKNRPWTTSQGLCVGFTPKSAIVFDTS